ncbi:MAG: hypothetical protein ACLQHT_09015 [Terracidiphilus sp.]
MIIDPASVTHFFYVVRPGVLEDRARAERKHLGSTLSPTMEARMWEDLIGMAPNLEDVSVLTFESDTDRDMEPPLHSLGLIRSSIRDCKYSLFFRTAAVEFSNRREEVCLGIAFKSSDGQKTISVGTEPAHFVTMEPVPARPRWQFWKK